MYHHGPCIWRIASFHPSQEGQEWSGVLWYPMVRPGRELELPHLSLFTGAVLSMEMNKGKWFAALCLRNWSQKTLFTGSYFEKCKCPDTVSSQLHCVQQGHLDEAVCFCSSRRPVLVTFHLQQRHGVGFSNKNMEQSQINAQVPPIPADWA